MEFVQYLAVSGLIFCFSVIFQISCDRDFLKFSVTINKTPQVINCIVINCFFTSIDQVKWPYWFRQFSTVSEALTFNSFRKFGRKFVTSFVISCYKVIFN